MNKIWANRLIAGTKTFDEVPVSRKIGVKAELRLRVQSSEITTAQYEDITGESYE